MAPRRPLHFPLEVGLVRNLDSLFGEIPGERLRAGRRDRRPWQEIRRQHPRRQSAVAPNDLVEQLVDPFHRRKQCAPRRPLDGEASELAEKLPALGMEAHVRRANFLRPGVSGIVCRVVRAFPHRHVAEQPVRQSVAQPEPLPGKRQVGDPVLGCVRIARRRHDLKAAVEHERMDVERALILPGGQHHLAERLAIPRPERGQCAEGGAEVDPDRGLGAVVGGQVHRREHGLHPVDIERWHGRRRAGRAARDPPLRMQHPAVLTLAAAEDPDPARPAVLAIVEQNLHPPARVLCIFLGEDQRGLHPKIFDEGRVVALGAAGRCRHGAVECPRRDQPAEDAMVGEPRWIGGEDLRVEGDLPARGLVAAAEQRVVACLPPPLRRLDPVALALEGIARQRDASPRLAGEEPVVTERQPRLVGTGDRSNKAAAGARRGRLFIFRRPNQARHHRRRRPAGRRPGHGRHRPQHGMGADLDDGIDAHLG